MEKKVNVLDMAKKKRHIYLLEKIQKGKTLKPTEITELEKFEGKESLPVGVVVTQGDVAKYFNVTIRTIGNWCREGLPKTENGYFDLAIIRKWREVKDAARKKGKDPNMAEYDMRFRRAKAELAEMELARRRGELLDRQEVERNLILMVQTVKAALLSLPKQLAPQVAVIDVKAAQVILEKRIREIIENFARG